MASEADHLQYMLQGLGIDCNNAPSAGLSRDSSDEHATEEVSTSGISESANDTGDIAERVLGYVSKSEMFLQGSEGSWDRAADSVLPKSATAPQLSTEEAEEDMMQLLQGATPGTLQQMFTELVKQSTLSSLTTPTPAATSSSLAGAQRLPRSTTNTVTINTTAVVGGEKGTTTTSGGGGAAGLPRTETVVPPQTLNIPLMPNLEQLMKKRDDKLRQQQLQEEKRREKDLRKKEQAAAAAAGSPNDDEFEEGEGGKKRRRRRRKPKKDRKDEAYWKNAPDAGSCMIVPVTEDDEVRSDDGADAPEPVPPQPVEPAPAAQNGSSKNRKRGKNQGGAPFMAIPPPIHAMPMMNAMGDMGMGGMAGMDMGMGMGMGMGGMGGLGMGPGMHPGAGVDMGLPLGMGQYGQGHMLPADAFAQMTSTGSEMPMSLSVFNFANS